MTTIHEINRVGQLAPFRRQWQSLLAETPSASFYQSLEWLEIYWKHFGQQQQLRTLILSDQGEIVGVLPLVLRHERTRVGTLRTLTYPLDGWASFYGPIGRDTEQILSKGLAYLAGCRRNWDLVDLRWIRSDEGEWVFTESALRGAGFDCEAEPYEQLATIRLAGSWEDYWKQFKPHERDNIRRGERKLAKQGTVEYLRYRPRGQHHDDADPRWDLYDACQQVASRSWQGSAADGSTLSSESVRDFYHDAHHAAAAAGAIDLNLIRLDGQPAAFAYNYHRGGEVYVIKMGFDPALAKTGVGKLLLARMIEDSYRRGDRKIDMGPESFHYKRIWLTHVETSYRCRHYAAASPRAQSLRLARWARSVMRRELKGRTPQPTKLETDSHDRQPDAISPVAANH
jgi:CelD/BcsL family acetyltransferase involved in cellulose biosynthesis